jgi:hypothetical protein
LIHDGARYHTSASTQAFLTAHNDRLTFRTLFRTAEAILEEPPAENGGGAIYRRCYVL